MRYPVLNILMYHTSLPSRKVSLIIINIMQLASPTTPQPKITFRGKNTGCYGYSYIAQSVQ